MRACGLHVHVGSVCAWPCACWRAHQQPHAAPCGPRQPTSRLPHPPHTHTQGGPGFEGPRPSEASGWIKMAANNFRVLLMDPRGTGLSSQISIKNLAKVGGPKEQARYLSYFRCVGGWVGGWLGGVGARFGRGSVQVPAWFPLGTECLQHAHSTSPPEAPPHTNPNPPPTGLTASCVTRSKCAWPWFPKPQTTGGGRSWASRLEGSAL